MSSPIPKELKYTEDHEWVKVDGDTATVGITDHAQSELGDIIFIEFPEINDIIERMEPFGTIEAVKTVADLFAPLNVNDNDSLPQLADHHTTNTDISVDIWKNLYEKPAFL